MVAGGKGGTGLLMSFLTLGIGCALTSVAFAAGFGGSACGGFLNTDFR